MEDDHVGESEASCVHLLHAGGVCRRCGNGGAVMQYMHNMKRENDDGSTTWCLVYFDWATGEHVYRYIEVR